MKALSGGERNRLLLARLFTRPANVLVLDEPTNDLDIETLELLEAQLVDWPGTLLLVSHDRAFLDNVVTSTLVFEGNGARPGIASAATKTGCASARTPRRPARVALAGAGAHRAAARRQAATGRIPPTPRRRRDGLGCSGGLVAEETLLQRAPRARRPPRPHRRRPRIRADSSKRQSPIPASTETRPKPSRPPSRDSKPSRPPYWRHWPAGTPSTPAIPHDHVARLRRSLSAGPNGAGKSTAVPQILRGALGRPGIRQRR